MSFQKDQAYILMPALQSLNSTGYCPKWMLKVLLPLGLLGRYSTDRMPYQQPGICNFSFIISMDDLFLLYYTI